MVEVTVKLNRIKQAPLSCDLVFPAKWDELSRAQFLYIAKYWESWKDISTANESLRKAKALLVLELCGLKSRKELKKLCYILSFVDETTNANILDCCNFVFDKLDLTVNHLPKIKVGMFSWFFGPGDRLNDVTIEEFSFAFSAYVHYLKTGNETHLNNLVAVLYRPVNDDYQKTGDIRIPFNQKLIVLHAKKTKRMHEDYKQGVLLFFMGVVNALEKKYPFVFRRSQANEASGKGSFIDTTIAMSGGKFGHFDTTKATNMHIFLKELNSIIKKEKNRK